MSDGFVSEEFSMDMSDEEKGQDGVARVKSSNSGSPGLLATRQMSAFSMGLKKIAEAQRHSPSLAKPDV